MVISRKLMSIFLVMSVSSVAFCSWQHSWLCLAPSLILSAILIFAKTYVDTNMQFVSYTYVKFYHDQLLSLSPNCSRALRSAHICRLVSTARLHQKFWPDDNFEEMPKIRNLCNQIMDDW